MPYTLITGGVRSGKSAFAERLAGLSRRVLYVATGQVWDGEMEKRIDLHRERRPEIWGLLEVQESLVEPVLAEVEAGRWEAVLVDDLSTWVSTILLNLPEEEWRSEATRERLFNEARRLAEALQASSVLTVLVTSETGLGGVALTPLGRAFQDLLGEVNQIVAAKAEDVYFVISGRPLKLPQLEEAVEHRSSGGGSVV
ncbi:bifunctional adenosylcobinamide kinase/adenosylcobinamide-phosphate guanylyltransferase [Tumebacillus sp. ITR2]|uniref:Adenosylcobinamide kinase n=1 Tax=Tumebacillus amylolyticus TaxID=2801339 RepID=A0ABS1J6Y8_9BACL|nr:bifunctional adenosylcobinamide kinase/adenosylcobinamide-phosphate guanylyltransferase [Tumebacillus amylolyticus]MBL0385819.1 bifunctional adenosylcobinamide kinase/adenosylcobinamide-phosphate guanylyltransferase [Tumebacillus amylolyticus]